jgi:GGDEF domain-containing protein
MQAMHNVVESLVYFASHDSLTGALTKDAIKCQAGELVEAKVPIGLFMMDWDAFKLINDTFGHEKADEMLSDFGLYFQQHFRRQGESVAHERIYRSPMEAEDNDHLLGRYGGDEFAFIVNLSGGGNRDGLTPEQRMTKEEQYVRSTIAGFVELQDQPIKALRYGISVGGSMWLPPKHAQKINSVQVVSGLFKRADAKLLLDKKARGAPKR